MPNAIIKGAGPTGLSAALSLISEYSVIIFEKRPARLSGEKGRQNMVALRPSALRRLASLGVLQQLLATNQLTPITQGRTHNEPQDTIWGWPVADEPLESFLSQPEDETDVDALLQRAAAEVPCFFVTLGTLEDVLLARLAELGGDVRFGRSFRLVTSGRDQWRVVAFACDGTESAEEDLGVPDLVVCASGKGDAALPAELNFTRSAGVQIDSPSDIIGERAFEQQRYSVFGVRSGAAGGVIDHVWRQTTQGEGTAEQPLVEIEMRHGGASHLLLQVPRGIGEGALEGWLREVLRRRVEGGEKAVFEGDELVWGEPLRPVVVDTVCAPKFVFGNVVLVGDAAVSCSPASGLGAEIGFTMDAAAVGDLGRALAQASTDHERSQAREVFGRRKASTAVVWSQGSRPWYLRKEKAEDILKGSVEARL